ncbi:hypothetical protein [Phenylobacterium sp.]|jgi:hypothetical protein|uniref:hypothetical protein n=1 Tax=Phenylobacterium sp. TaxID=1871053 RepID=UPI002F93D4AD
MVQTPDQPPSQPRRKRLILLGGGVVAVAGAAVAWMLLQAGQGERTAPPASQGGLVIDSSAMDENLDPARPLRCFVAGQFVGELTLAQCAQRNGVATDALDVGVDETGALAAADQAGQVLTPLPPAGAEPLDTDDDADVSDPIPAEAPKAQPARAPTAAAACWRYADNQWRKLPNDMTLGACVQTLFAGRCERTGGATYGRWSQQTLRLMPGRVEVSGDNRSFRPLAEQAANCTFPSLG